MDEKIQQLLRIQESDLEREQTQKSLEQLPTELRSIEDKIEAEKSADAALVKELKDLEVGRKDVDGQLKLAEDKLVELKTKQAAVKKAEEFEALNNEIDACKAKISDLETAEIELLMSIDEKHAAYEEGKSVFAERIASLEGQKSQVEGQEGELKARLEGLNQAVARAEEGVDEDYLLKYRQVANQVKRGPYVVPLEGNKCGGCHLKVSNDVLGTVKVGDVITQCDNCSRIVYYLAP